LSSLKGQVQAVPVYNQYVVSDLKEIQEKYPYSVEVELYYDSSSYLIFIFVSENNSWKLRSFISHAFDLA
jgi:hypothetical protein